MMPLVMGIDGGGSTIRVAIVRDDLAVVGESIGATVNPSVIGHASSAERIRETMRTALANAGVSPEQIAAVGIGIAGAAAEHSATWLREVASPVLPSAQIVPSNDLEIALVGARGERRGILILAGTGSAAYGVNDAGESLLVGGWGYLLGDEGSGYWIGMEALREIARHEDSGVHTQLRDVVLSTLNITDPRQLVQWLYQSETNRIREIAALAPLVMEIAAVDHSARLIISNAAAHLATMGLNVSVRLQIAKDTFAFAGGLLESPTLLRKELVIAIGMSSAPYSFAPPVIDVEVSSPPLPLYPPVIGAALLALMRLSRA
jgi:N-acetylglucosamine kinase-like BadF-type ATPase